MCEKHPTPRHIQGQNSPKSQQLPPVRDQARLTNQRTLTRNTYRIKHIECIISQPRHKPRHTTPLQVEDEVAVAYDLCDGPGKEHGAV